MDYYDVLGVPRDADLRAIKAAYRKIAKETHPDSIRGREDPISLRRYREATEAYRVLCDPDSRRKYDLGFAPIATMSELFSRNPFGRRVAQTMLPAAEAAPVPGIDLWLKMTASPKCLKKGGQVSVALPRGGEIELPVPAGEISPRWCRLPQMGGLGKNGAENGDLWILVYPEE